MGMRAVTECLESAVWPKISAWYTHDPCVTIRPNVPVFIAKVRFTLAAVRPISVRRLLASAEIFYSPIAGCYPTRILYNFNALCGVLLIQHETVEEPDVLFHIVQRRTSGPDAGITWLYVRSNMAFTSVREVTSQFCREEQPQL